MPRDSSGNFTLTGPNPYPAQTLTTISSTAFNTMLADLQSAMTNSLSRTGLGGMLSPFQVVDGTITAPAVAFEAEAGSGLWRKTAGDVEMSILGQTITRWTAANFFQVSFDNGTTWGSPAITTGTTNFTGTFQIGGQTITTPARAASRNQSVATSFSNSTPTLLVFPTTTEDNLSGVTIGPPWKYTVQAGAAGDYLVVVGLYMSLTGASGTALLIEVLKNGSAFFDSRTPLVTGYNFAPGHISCIIPGLVATDTITVRATQNSGSTGTLTIGDANANYIQISKQT